MKVAVIAPIAFVLGLAGGTFAMKKSPAEVPVAGADSTHVEADSTKVKHDSSTVKIDSAAVAPDTTAVKTDSAAAPAAAHGEKPVSPPVTTAPAATTPPPAVAATPDYKRLAGILGKLSAAEAAPLLEHFTDAEVEGVLRRMDVTRVAGLLAALPKDRSATLGKRLLLAGAGAPK